MKSIKKENKPFNVKILYTYKFISECLPIYAFYTILFIERGKSITEVALLIALWSLFAIPFEIPAGILADRWSRRNMLALASVLQGICFIVWFFSHTFFMFALGFAFWAIAGAFVSGTEEGLIYDNLKSDGREEEFTKIYGRAHFFANIGALFGIASAGVIATFIRIDTIALISAVICFISVSFALQIREKNFYSEKLSSQSDDESSGFFGTIKEAGTFIKGSKVALFSIIFLVFFASIGSYMDEFDALIANDWDLHYVWVSVILTVRFIFVAIGDLLAPMVGKKVSTIKGIFLLNGFSYLILLAFVFFWSHYFLLVFGLAFLMMTVTEILLVNVLQNEIKEEGRATVMSFFGMGQNAVMIGFSLIYALLAGWFTLQQVYLIFSVYGIVGGIIFYLFARTLK